MCALMYKEKPAYPALVGAGIIMLLGTAICYALHRRVEVGIGNPSLVMAVGCVSFGIAGILLIVAFARYQFGHWKNPDPAFEKRHPHHSRRPGAKR